MGYKTLELTLISGKDLKNVSMMGKMDVYVVVSISGDPGSKQKTPTHQDGGTSPCWNHTLRFTFDEATATYSGWEVVCLLKHDAFGPDKDLGEVRLPIKDLLAGYQGKTDAPEFLTYQVKSKSSGKAKGELKISYKLKDAAAPPVHKAAPAYPAHAPAYPASSSGAAYAYPPPPQGAGYGYAPPPQGAAYAYPAAAPGYPPQQQQPGYQQYGLAMGLGAGLIRACHGAGSRVDRRSRRRAAYRGNG